MSNIIRIGGGGDLDQIQFTQNGTYVAEDYGIDGFYRCFVAVQPNVDQIKLTQDGEYLASTYGIDGFYKVIVETDESNVNAIINKSIETIKTVKGWTAHAEKIIKDDENQKYYLQIWGAPIAVNLEFALDTNKRGVHINKWNFTNSSSGYAQGQKFVDYFYPYDSAFFDYYSSHDIIPAQESYVQMDCIFRNINANACHPYFVETFDNENLYKMSDFAGSVKPRQIWDLSAWNSYDFGEPVTGAMIFDDPNGNAGFVCVLGGSGNPQAINNQLSGHGKRTWQRYMFSDMRNSRNTLVSVSTPSGSMGTISVDISNYKPIFNTKDILDGDGNVLYPANCTLADFGF